MFYGCAFLSHLAGHIWYVFRSSHTHAEVKLSECEPIRNDEEYDGSDTICLVTAV